MARSNVPKFGNWENEDNVPYTVYFDKARKTRGGKMMNPNDPQENPAMFPNAVPSPPPAEGAVGPTREHGESREDGDLRHFNKSPARGDDAGQRTANESNYGGRGRRPGRSARPTPGSEQSLERSPLHPHYQAKVMGTGSSSPGWDGKSNDNSHGNHGRSRLRPAARGDESPDKGAAVPRFGEWDENDPQSAENFTHIFNKVREERNTGPGNVSGTPRHPTNGTRTQQDNEKKVIFEHHISILHPHTPPNRATTGLKSLTTLRSRARAIVPSSFSIRCLIPILLSFDTEVLLLFLVIEWNRRVPTSLERSNYVENINSF